MKVILQFWVDTSLRMKMLLIWAALVFFPIAAMALPLDHLKPYFNHFKNRQQRDLTQFTRLAGWTSQFRALSPSHSLGVWGMDAGLELTSVPKNTFHFSNYDLDLPTVFPRFNIAKGITKNLDLEASLLAPKIIKTKISIPKELNEIFVYGGALKYTILPQDRFFISFASRFSYSRLRLGFFKADILGADGSLSRSLTIPFVPLTLTPYMGIGYVSTLGTFYRELSFVSRGKQKTQNYHYFGGMSVKFYFLDITGQIDRSDSTGNSEALKTYSIKMSVDI